MLFNGSSRLRASCRGGEPVIIIQAKTLKKKAYSDALSGRRMVDSGILWECWEIKLKKCETSPRPSEGRLCVRPSPMVTQYIHTQQEARLVPGRSVILFYFIHVVLSLWTSCIGCKKLSSPIIIQSVTLDSLTAVRHCLAILNVKYIHICTAMLGM